MSVIDDLRRGRDFTATDRSIADYILHHPDEAARITIGDLARVTYTSNAAVIRLCRKVGASGYRDLRVQLVADLERRRNRIEGVDADRPFTERESCATMIASVAKLEQEAIDACYQSLAASSVEAVAQDVIQAPHVLVYAIGETRLIAEQFSSMVSKLGIHAIIAGRHGDYASATNLAVLGDVALFVTYSGKILGYDAIRQSMATLSARGCVRVLITSSATDADLADAFDHVLTFPAREDTEGAIGPFYSSTCLRFVLNCLYARVYALDFATHDAAKLEVDRLSH